jgi:hypothetical protein
MLDTWEADTPLHAFAAYRRRSIMTTPQNNVSVGRRLSRSLHERYLRGNPLVSLRLRSEDDMHYSLERS